MSEFGFQSLPSLETIRAYADQSDWNMTSYIMEHHQRSPIGNSKIITYMTDYFRLPKDFESLVYLTQVLQAEAIRFGVEHWRRNGHRTSGTLYWQLNDCWPVASWASLDYYGRWKALHYAARRFHAPLLLSVYDDQTKMGMYVTSDLTQPWDGTVRWSLESLTGDVHASGQEEVSATPLSTTRIQSLDFAEHIKDDYRRDLIFVSELWQDNQRVTLDVTPFVPDKHLSLNAPKLDVKLHPAENQLVFEVTAQSLARFVELSLADAKIVFSDNYFDVPAGRTVTVTCPLPEGWTEEDARRGLSVRSLYDSFA
jgi:beta-mannosidase